jgi:hypothetical protein
MCPSGRRTLSMSQLHSAEDGAMELHHIQFLMTVRRAALELRVTASALLAK